MSDKHEAGLDKFACIHCEHIYHRHGLRETFCENCDRILEVKKVDVDMVNNPPHYKDASGIECIEVTQHMKFCGGNCFKYLYRAGKKGSTVEDLKKAIWYAERACELDENLNQEARDKIREVRRYRELGIQNAMRAMCFSNWMLVIEWIEAEIARLESE